MVVDDLCPLCGLQAETHNHLFFSCPFSLLCVESIKAWTSITLKPILHMELKKCRLSKAKWQVLTVIFDCTIYHIWKCRNKAVRYEFVRSPGHVITMIKQDIRQRCQALNLTDTVDF